MIVIMYPSYFVVRYLRYIEIFFRQLNFKFRFPIIPIPICQIVWNTLGSHSVRNNLIIQVFGFAPFLLIDISSREIGCSGPAIYPAAFTLGFRKVVKCILNICLDIWSYITVIWLIKIFGTLVNPGNLVKHFFQLKVIVSPQKASFTLDRKSVV